MNEKQIYEYLKTHLKINTYMWHMSGILGVQLILKDPEGKEQIISEVKENIR